MSGQVVPLQVEGHRTKIVPGFGGVRRQFETLPESFQSGDRLLQTARTATAVFTTYEVSQAAYNIATGQSSIWDATAVMMPAAAGVSRFFKWVQCFEGDTLVSRDWADLSRETAANEESSASLWWTAAFGLILVAAWPKPQPFGQQLRQRRPRLLTMRPRFGAAPA